MTTPFLRPNYGQGCFADLPMLIKRCLIGQPLLPDQAGLWGEMTNLYDVVIVVLADAFGWRFFERFADSSPFLQRFTQEGQVLRWTSQFPSTTAAHVTCIHTGLCDGQSGIFEWQYYEPQLDALITPLLFSYAGTKQRDTLKETGIQPAQLYPAQTLYQELQQWGVNSHIFQHREYTPSTYSDWVNRGAQVHPYATLPEALVNLRQLISQSSRPAYCFLYFDRIDAIGHEYGPDSPQMDAEIETFLFCMERALMQPLAGKLKNALLVVTADHGQIEVDPRTAVYLNLEPRLKGLQRYLRTDHRGEVLPPGGSPRDAFLYVKDVWLDHAVHFLAERLGDKAQIWKTQDLIDQGYFGPLPVAQSLLDRVGNLVILPYGHETVWWYEKGKYEQKFYGHHGGLTPQEMEIPVCLYQFGG